MDWRLHKVDSAPSTQDLLKDLIRQSPQEAQNLCVQAARQSAGRGRHGRVWNDGIGNLMMSFAIKPECDLRRIGELSILSGVCVALALRSILPQPDDVMLKWPNDVLVSGKKISGLLLEIEDDFLIIGIGVNIAMAAHENAIALHDIVNGLYSPDDVRELILTGFADKFTSWRENGFEPLREEWLSLATPKDMKLSVKLGDEVKQGFFETIDGFGNLILRDASNNLVRITSGDVYL